MFSFRNHQSALELSHFAESAMAVKRVILQHFSMRYDYITSERPNIYEPSRALAINTTKADEENEEVKVKANTMNTAKLNEILINGQNVATTGSGTSNNVTVINQDESSDEGVNECDTNGVGSNNQLSSIQLKPSDIGDEMYEKKEDASEEMVEKEGNKVEVEKNGENSKRTGGDVVGLSTSPVKGKYEMTPLESFVGKIRQDLPNYEEEVIQEQPEFEQPEWRRPQFQQPKRSYSEWNRKIAPEQNWRYRSSYSADKYPINYQRNHYNGSSNNSYNSARLNGGGKRGGSGNGGYQHQQYNNSNNYHNNRNYNTNTGNKYSNNKDASYNNCYMNYGAKWATSTGYNGVGGMTSWRNNHHQQKHHKQPKSYDAMPSSNMQIYEDRKTWRSGGESNDSASSTSSSPNEADSYIGLSPPMESLLMQRRLRNRTQAPIAIYAIASQSG